MRLRFRVAPPPHSPSPPPLCRLCSAELARLQEASLSEQVAGLSAHTQSATDAAKSAGAAAARLEAQAAEYDRRRRAEVAAAAALETQGHGAEAAVHHAVAAKVCLLAGSNGRARGSGPWPCKLVFNGRGGAPRPVRAS
eukprot:327763-Chlamydomonas_euryale.AAC.4